MDEKYYIVDKKVLPKIYEKVIAAKKLLNSGRCKTVYEATEQIGISRAVYYKYKDYVSVFVEKSEQKIITINMLLMDRVGVLSNVLQQFSDAGASILTINQNIPIDDIAPVSISLATESLCVSLDEVMDKIRKINGMIRVDIIAKE